MEQTDFNILELDDDEDDEDDDYDMQD